MIATLDLLMWPFPISPSIVKLQLVVPGDPVSKARARFAKVKGQTRIYTPSVTRDAQEAIAYMAKLRYHEGINGRDAFGVRILFCCRSHERKDVDNLSKLVMDACTKVVWRDDKQVNDLFVRAMRSHPEPATHILIYTLGPDGATWKKCRRCKKEFRYYPSTQWSEFCSRACYAASMRTGAMNACKVCGQEFYLPPWRAEKNVARYCSNACKTEDNTTIVTCATCNVQFRKPKSWISRAQHGLEFCTPEHRSAWAKSQALRTVYGTGKCMTCGGMTSRKEYTSCRACAYKRDGKKLPPHLMPTR